MALDVTERTFALLLWPPYVIGQAIIFLPCGFFLSFLFSSPNLSGRRLDVYHMALVRIQNVDLKCAARGSLEIQDPKDRRKFAIWAPSHNVVGLYLHKKATYIDNRKKFAKH